MEKSHGRGSVHIVVSIDQNFLSADDCPVKPFDRLVHILHQERVVEIVQTRPEEGTGLLEGLHSPLHEKVGKHPVDAHLCAETLDLLRISGFLYCPFALLYHCASFLFNSPAMSSATRSALRPSVSMVIPALA